MGLGILGIGAAVAGCGGAGGGGGDSDSVKGLAAQTATLIGALADPVLNTFLNKSIEIDEAEDPSGTTVPAPDCNLFVGPDPADGTASYQKPTGGPATFVDWTDLSLAVNGGQDNHLLGDCPGPITGGVQACTKNGADPTSFPQSNNCVGSSQVLSKMDITYVGFSNNGRYAYATVQRSANNGDAGWYWIFTKLPSHLGAAGTGGCKSNEQPLTYDITGSTSESAARDVLLVGHFQPSAAPLVRVFRALKNTTATDAVSAIDYTDTSLWQEVSGGVANAAVNTTPTDPGSFGYTGVNSLIAAGKPGCDNDPTSPQCLDTEIQTEVAVPISVFTGGGAACGVTFYGSVITRSSGSGGTSPDLKDLAGPAQFVFGSNTTTATLTGTCNLSFTYSATVTDASGTDVTAASTCSWVFKDKDGNAICGGSGQPACPTNVPCGTSASFSVATAGTYSGTVTASNPNAPGCNATATSQQVQVLSGLSLSLAAQTSSLTCPMTADAIQFNATASGGNPPYSYTWTIDTGSGAVAAPNCGSTAASCVIDPDSGATETYCTSATVGVSVSDSSGGLCPSVGPKTGSYTKTTSVTASVP